MYNTGLQDLPIAPKTSVGMEAILIEVPRLDPGATSEIASATYRDPVPEAALLNDAAIALGMTSPEIDTSAVVQRPVTEPPAVPRADYVWKFLVNPEQIRIEGGDAAYESLLPHLGDRPELFYKGNSPRTMDLPNLWLETWFHGKSVMPLLEGITALMRSNPDNREYEPPTMQFVWGTRRFGPCKVIKATWVEDKWLGGEPAGVRLNLTLQEVNEEAVSDPYEPPLPPQDSPETAAPIELTPRQVDEFNSAARQWLKDNATTQGFDAIVAYTLSQQEFITRPSTDGTCVVADVEGKQIGTIGTWKPDSILEDWEPDLISFG
jgi:hypothetical protein